MGANSDQIVNEILKSNPNKLPVFQQAKSMGANADQILDEITKQNTRQGGKGLQGGIVGFEKGVASTLARPFQSLGQIIGAVTQSLTGDSESIVKATQVNNKVLSEAMKLPINDPKRRQLIEQVLKSSVPLSNVATEQVKSKEAFQQEAQDVGGVQEKLKPVGTAEQIGFGLERISEFLVPGGAIHRLEKNVETGIKAANLVKNYGTAGKVLEKGLSIGSKSLIEGVAFGAQSLSQGATPQEAKDAAILGAIFPPAIAGAGVVLRPAIKAIKPIKEGLGVRIINSLIKPLARDFSYAKNPGRSVSKLGITGNSLEDLATNVTANRQKVGQSIGELVEQVPELRLDLRGSLKFVDEAMQQAAVTNNSNLLQRLGEVKQSITDILTLENGKIVSAGNRELSQMSVQDATKLKRLLGDLTRWTTNISDDNVANKALKQTYGYIRDSIEDIITKYDEKLGAKLSGLNETYGDLLSAEKAITYRDKIVQRQDMISLKARDFGIATGIATFLASGGAALPAVLAGVTGAMLDKALSSTYVKTRIARWLAMASPEEKKIIFSKFPMLRGTIDRFFGGGTEVKPMPKVQKAVTGAIKGAEETIKQAKVNPRKGGIDLPMKKGSDSSQDLSQTLRGTKGLTAQDIMKTHPNIKLTKDVPATDIYGNKVVIPDGEKLTPYELKGNKVLLQDGETYIVSKNQFQNIKGNSVGGEPKPFAPELQGLEETVKGNVGKEINIGKKFTADALSQREYGKPYGEITNEQRGIIQSRLSQNERIGKVTTDPTKYSQYQLPGGQSYKEILIKAPINKGEINTELVGKLEAERRNYGRSTIAYQQKTKELNDLRQGIQGIQGNFKSSHWDEPNVISHLRMNERTYKGKKVAFMEELQSDWAREARKNPFMSDNDVSQYLKLSDDFGNLSKTQEERFYKLEGTLDDRYQIPNDDPATWLREKLKGTPNNPNLKNWQELSVKRALKEAVDSKAEYFSWINGEQTSARYNLATQVKEVMWESTDLGKPITVVPKAGSPISIRINKEGVIERAGKEDWKGKKLDEVLGKGLADKIMAQETGTLTGEGLKFGGEWADNLYNRQVKNIVEDLTGGKVEMLDLGLPIDAQNRINWKLADQDTPLTINKLKVGGTIFAKGGRGDSYIITDVLGEGKFKAVPKSTGGFDELRFNKTTNLVEEPMGIDPTNRTWIPISESIKQSFDISQKTTMQQGIKITPEIRAKIEGKGMEIKTSGKKFNK